MIKLIGIDCDDTILDSNKNISKRTCEVIGKVNKKGVKCVLTTGRPFVEKTIEYYKLLNIYEENQYFIAYNGAAIFDVYNKNELSSITICQKEILEIHNYLKDYPVSHYIHKTGAIWYDVMNEYAYLEKKFNDIDLVKIDFDKLDESETAFKYMLGGEPKIIKEIFESLPRTLKEKYNVVISMPCFLEFMNKKVNKWNGLKELAKILNICEDEVMAIGDSMNDYEMILHSNIGVAMENSVFRIKEIADYITSSNDNDGVAKAIEELIIYRNV